MSELETTTDWWKGPAGDAYTIRNLDKVDGNVAFFERVLGDTPIKSAIELGCGSGQNMAALARLYPGINLWGVEINASAAERVSHGSVIRGSFLDFKMPAVPSKFDLSLAKGAFIHVHPDDIAQAYKRLYEASSKYIIVAEYFSPRREMVPYRGKDNVMWRADFGSEFMDLYPNLKLLSYGFAWRKDTGLGQDDLTWWMWRKR